MRKYRLIAILMMTALLGACGYYSPKHLAKPYMLKIEPPEGPMEYQAGWNDGCQSAMAATNNSFFMSVDVNRFIINDNLRTNSLYNTAWQYGYSHCGYSMKTLARYGF